MRVAVFVALVACSSAETRKPVAPVAPVAPEKAQVGVAAAQAADPKPPAFRLPGDVKPTSYVLEQTIVPDQSTVTGKVRIAAEVVQPTRVVWLNASGLTITSATLGGAAARVIPGGEDFVGFTTDRELRPGALTIEVAYAAPIDRGKSRGIYSEQEGKDRYVYTFFEPVDARRAFPCFDEPSYKVPWSLVFHVKAEHVALANAPVVREVPEAGGMKRVEIDVTKPLPSYLVAFVVGPFELVDGGTAGRVKTPIRFIIPKGRGGELGYAKQITPKVVAALEDYFDMAYPYVKLDVAVVPRFWGTMEHPGIVAMGQPLTLIRPDQETRSRKRGYVNILAHELSHYWFGDLVTMAWWDDTWLNEALGEWSDMNITEAAEPTWRTRDDRVGMTLNAMNADETLSTRSMRQPVTDREGIQASFDNQITYYKGASMFRMFESFVGRDAWRKFIHSYLRAHAWGNASAEDFLHSVAENLGSETAAAMRTFLEQPGVPRITAKLRCEPRRPPRIELTQQRSLPADVTDPTQKLWGVPVCMRYGNATSSVKECTLLSTVTASFELGAQLGGKAVPSCPSWMILNADAVGYYRSTVDPVIARSLLTARSPIARAAKPTPTERMMLVEDLRAAVARNELALDQMIELVPVVAADPDERVARSALSAAALPLAGVDDAMYRAGRAWVHKTFAARARRLGWQRGAKDSEELHELRRSIVPLVAQEDPALGAEATRLADQWLANRTGISDDMVGAALVVSARRGDMARFDRYVAAARSARDRTEHGRLLGTLGAFVHPDIANKSLALVLGKELDLRDSRGILFGVLGRRETREIGIAFIKVHLDELLGRMRDDEAAGFLAGLAGLYCDTEHRSQMASLVTPRAAKIDGAQGHVTRALEHVNQCIAETQRELPALRRVLGMK